MAEQFTVPLKGPVDKGALRALYAQYGAGMHRYQADCENCEYSGTTMLCEMTSNAGRCPLIVVELPS